MPIPAEILKKANNLRPLSQAASRLLEMVNNPQHNMKEVVKIVELDSVLTANVLRVANSAAFARSSSVFTIDRALNVLGEKMVVGIALGICAAQLFETPLAGYGSEAGELWRHCLRCAIAAREIAGFAKVEVSPDIAFTAGILHDLGKAVISSFLEGHTGELAAGADSGIFTDFVEAERETLGTDHAEVGGVLAAHWNLPDCLTQVMNHHHEPRHASQACRGLVYVVHLGDFVAMMMGSGTGADTMVYTIDELYRDYVKISRKELEKVLLRTGTEYEKTASIAFAG